MRLSINMCMLCGVFWVMAYASHIAYIYVWSMFCNLKSCCCLLASCMLLIRLYTLEPMMLPLHLPSGGMNDPSMYML